MKYRIFSILLVLILVSAGWFVYSTEVRDEEGNASLPFSLGLDLAGGTQLTYRADTSRVPAGELDGAMMSLRDTIERRVNLFGVSEPVVQVERASALTGSEESKLIVELPGITDIEEAVNLIGKTPDLEFKLLNPNPVTDSNSTTTVESDLFIDTGLNGRLLDRARLEFDPNTMSPVVTVTFNSEGKELFAEITRQNISKPLAIILDGEVKSMPTIREEIREGTAQITGNFTPEEARTLVRDLNYGALPVPIELVGTQSVGASLGSEAVDAGLKAGIIGFIALAVFMMLWYRLPGLIAIVSLLLYTVLSLSIFKLIPVTLTAAGIAGFVLSVGMAVDANVLIFERIKEELRRGKSLSDALADGFSRAWLSIRDSNISSIITAVVLFWLGTSAVKGFALTLGIGVAVSMFTAITASRTFLYAIAPKTRGKMVRFLFSTGIKLHISTTSDSKSTTSNI